MEKSDPVHDSHPREFPLEKGSYRSKVIKSMALNFGFFMLGTVFAVVGPTILDLQLLVGVSTETISFVFAGRSVFGLAGAIVTGFIVERINPWFMLSSLMLVMGTAYVFVPFSTDIFMMIIVFGIGGFCGAAYDGGANMVLLNIWSSDNGPWMQALHAIFGAGAWLGPLIAKPFLTEIDETETMAVGTEEASLMATTPEVVIQGDYELKHLLNLTLSPSVSSTAVTITNETNVVYAYIIVGALCFLTCALFCVLFMIGQRSIIVRWTNSDNKEEEVNRDSNQKDVEQKLTSAESDNKEDATCGSSNTNGDHRVLVLGMLIFFFYVAYCILEINYGNFLLTYAVKHLGWSKSSAASVTSAFWGSFTLGRACGIVMIKKLRPQTILGLDVTMCVVALVPVLIWSQHHPSVLWVCSIVFGFFMSTIFATGITWTELYVPFTGRIASIFIISGASGELVGPFIISLLFKGLGPWSFMYVMFSASVLVAVFFATMQTVASRYGERRGTVVNQDSNIEVCQAESPTLRGHAAVALHNTEQKMSEENEHLVNETTAGKVIHAEAEELV